MCSLLTTCCSSRTVSSTSTRGHKNSLLGDKDSTHIPQSSWCDCSILLSNERQHQSVLRTQQDEERSLVSPSMRSLIAESPASSPSPPPQQQSDKENSKRTNKNSRQTISSPSILTRKRASCNKKKKRSADLVHSNPCTNNSSISLEESSIMSKVESPNVPLKSDSRTDTIRPLVILNEQQKMSSSLREATKRSKRKLVVVPCSSAELESPQESVPTLATTVCEDLLGGKDTDLMVHFSSSSGTVSPFDLSPPASFNQQEDSSRSAPTTEEEVDSPSLPHYNPLSNLKKNAWSAENNEIRDRDGTSYYYDDMITTGAGNTTSLTSFVGTSPLPPPRIERQQQPDMNMFVCDERQQDAHKQQVLQFGYKEPKSQLSRNSKAWSSSNSRTGISSSTAALYDSRHLSTGISTSEKRDDSSPLTSTCTSPIASPPPVRDQWAPPSNVVAPAVSNEIQSQPIPLQSQRPILVNRPFYYHPAQHPRQQQPQQHRASFNLKPRPDNTYQHHQRNQQQRGYSSPSVYSNQNNFPVHSPKPPSPQAPYSPNKTNQPQLASPRTRAHAHHLHLTHSPVPNSGTSQSSQSPNSRTSPEILKTLLRKKACLYEPGTSRAIALITWLVGRGLALRHGYFSRQHLQSGVHAVVADRIESGVITRTKVNRCMQIILNSCFYYIIPKPDGTEEKGDCFKEMFKQTVKDDSHLLKTLAEPWRNLEILDDTLDERDQQENDDAGAGGDHGKPRQVLLCFNENVRCAEDVMRCHNEFIRDAAISANLVLSPEAWRSFYLQKDEEGLSSPPVHSPSKAASASDGSEIPYLSFEKPSPSSSCYYNNAHQKAADPNCSMSPHELSKFRTVWCCKRYEHDATLCKFAHLDVNKGWLRRDPTIYQYSASMCPHVGIVNNDKSSLNGCHVNACKDGKQCKFAHSQEEINYHPENYKTKYLCRPVTNKGFSCSCDLLDICPHLHKSPSSNNNNNNNLSYLSPRSPRHHPHHGGAKRGAGVPSPTQIKGHVISGKHSTSVKTSSTDDMKNFIPAGSPMIYLHPAPYSDLDKNLHFPGLQTLFRRNCASVYFQEMTRGTSGAVGGSGGSSAEFMYTNFGNDWETINSHPSLENLNETNNEQHGFSLFA